MRIEELPEVRVKIAFGRYRVGDIFRPYASERSALLMRQWI